MERKAERGAMASRTIVKCDPFCRPLAGRVVAVVNDLKR